MKYDLLAETTRGIDADHETVENSHFGAIAVVDCAGKVVHSWGDVTAISFTRSALKPFQALPFVTDGGIARFGFTLRELALMCASHAGEDKHLAVVRGMLDRIGANEGMLACGCHVPGWYAISNTPAPPLSAFTQIHNNCSGKHTGFLGWCMLHGVPVDDYLALGHPLQERIRAAIVELADLGAGPEPGPETLAVGIDGCSAPNYALPLERLAFLYARLASVENGVAADSRLHPLFDAMTSHPDLVSGTGRSDLAYMQAGAGDWVAKAGADGVQAIGIRSAGLGIAIKIADGTPRALHRVTTHLLDLLGLLGNSDSQARKILAPWIHAPIRNHRGLVTGRMRPAFSL